jgi:hypothetical protein
MNGEPPESDAATVEAQAALDQMLNGYWITQIIHVAAELGIADLLAERPQSVDALAVATDSHAPSLYRFMRALAGVGLVRQNDEGLFTTTALGRCLVTGSQGALRGRAILCGGDWYAAWGELLRSVQTGETAFDHVMGMAFFDYLAANPASGAIFNETMARSSERAAKAVVDAYDFGRFRRVVDVGAGTGVLLAAVLRANQQAQGVLFDKAEVVAGAPEVLSAAGVADRCEVLTGDFFATAPRGGDAYVLSMIIHDWDDDQSVTILGVCREAMANDARLLLIEQIVPPGNEPSLSKLYDLHMLVLLGGRERTEEEYRRLLAKAGFQLTRVVHTEVPRCVIEALPV